MIYRKLTTYYAISPLLQTEERNENMRVCFAVCNLQGHKSWQQNMSRRWEEKLHERDEEIT